jgi:hypothetical protein
MMPCPWKCAKAEGVFVPSHLSCSADIPMLVAGDFNSIPGSPAHCLLVKGKIEASMMVSR